MVDILPVVATLVFSVQDRKNEKYDKKERSETSGDCACVLYVLNDFPYFVKGHDKKTLQTNRKNEKI